MNYLHGNVVMKLSNVNYKKCHEDIHSKDAAIWHVISKWVKTLFGNEM